MADLPTSLRALAEHMTHGLPGDGVDVETCRKAADEIEVLRHLVKSASIDCEDCGSARGRGCFCGSGWLGVL